MASVSFDFYSFLISRSIHFEAFIPADQVFTVPPNPPYKTVYFLTGFADNAHGLIDRTRVSELADAAGIALIIMDGNNSFYVDANPMSRYSTFIGEDLLKITRRLFPLSDKREDTYIAGMSMGGFGAFYNGVKHADKFSKIAMLAPGFGVYDVVVPGLDIPAFDTAFLNPLFGSKERYEEEINFNAMLDLYQKQEQKPELFMGIGESDPQVGGVCQKFMEKTKEIGLDVDYHMVPGAHDFVFLDNILPLAFDFLKK